MEYGLLITREIASRAILDKSPEAKLFGIPKLILLNFEDIRWVNYLPPEKKWWLDFYDQQGRIMWVLTYF